VGPLSGVLVAGRPPMHHLRKRRRDASRPKPLLTAVLTGPSIPASGTQSFQYDLPPLTLMYSVGQLTSIRRPRLIPSYTKFGSTILTRCTENSFSAVSSKSPVLSSVRVWASGAWETALSSLSLKSPARLARVALVGFPIETKLPLLPPSEVLLRLEPRPMLPLKCEPSVDWLPAF
jgi:hypothetical protein